MIVQDISNKPSLPQPQDWNSQPQNLPINEALLQGAKALLKSIYTFSDNSQLDYLPFSYTNKKDTTKYVIHAVEPTFVSWQLNEQEYIEWLTQPEGSPRGWSGTVVAAGKATTSTQLVVTQCFTDCSGFITSLFSYANAQHSTQFEGWQQGASVPEAGCFDPYEDCLHPNPANYYRFFSHSEHGFQNVQLHNLMPGDIIAYANTANHKDTGHIMLVAAVADWEDGSKLVVVIDETGSPHSYDTRGQQKTDESSGVGMGIAKLSVTNDNKIMFYWGIDSEVAEQGAIALGRSL